MATTVRRARGGDLKLPAREAPASPRVRRPRLFSSLRARVLASFVGLLALATLASVLAARALVLDSLDERISSELVQETKELRTLADGNDPETGRPFGDRVRRIFSVYLESNVPSRNEALLTFVDGKPFRHSRQPVPYPLDTDPELVSRWANVTTTEFGRVDTPAGAVEYVAVPVRAEARTRGVFVGAIFRDRERAEFDSAVVAVGGVGIAVAVFGSLLAWGLAAGMLRPVRRATATARTITETDLSRRIPVDGDDEVADLAKTFNEMLDRLETAFTTQRRLADDAGHELRTPITIIRGHLELLGDDPVERREVIALVMDELDRMARIVNDLLLLAKAQEPGFLELDPVDVAALTDELHAKAAGLAGRDWRIESRARAVIVADRQRLTQAVVQLAQNAVEHTDDGDEIAIGSSVRPDETRFWVRDTGPGIPPEEQERIFSRFARGTETRRSGGAGLGLAIVKAIAEAHGGRVEVTSRLGEGATFTIAVPTDHPAEKAAA
jgi:signal transduction histidine kinase